MSDAASARPVASERYRRQTVLAEVGTAGQHRIRAARVLVVGAGGLGSPLLISLAAAGIGTIGLVD
ncbi:MAG: ThiF family adenylyltransferase, partial [Mycetocola sp.]